ncbi:MAG: hypothetical protein PHS45_01650 [Bacilli bacterium]|nr:hypothetical protein [Bacilli bacterium]
MKNVINYYYNLYPDNIRQENRDFNFIYLDDNYYFIPYNRPIEEVIPLFELNKEMINKGLLVHEIITNKDKHILTNIDKQSYIMLRVYINAKLKTSIVDINYFNNMVGLNYKQILNKSDWVKLWSDKIDYIEYQINQIGKKYSLICESISYFIGLSENAISYIKNVDIDLNVKKLNNLIVSHRRISINDTLFDTYNPLNFVIDYRIRDLSEYIKSHIFVGKNIWFDIDHYFKRNNLSVLEYRLLFGRLLFPSFYFDIYDKVIKEEIPEQEIITVVNRINYYEDFLREFYDYIKIKANIPEVEWLR